ncbi:MAG: hypothetical protein Q7R56_00425 [Nanoarchaeota archaeon]|nr:hypothetical protein [Nanoarchaeota archaeon]
MKRKINFIPARDIDSPPTNNIFEFQRFKVKDAIEFPSTLIRKARAHEHHFKKQNNQNSKRTFEIHLNDTKNLCLMQRTK